MNPSLFMNYSGPLLALASAALFGVSMPIAKLLLGVIDPLLLAGLLYLGSGSASVSSAWAPGFQAEPQRRRCVGAISRGLA